MRGRPRLPDAVKAARGTLQPCRVNKHAPKADPVTIGEPPRHLMPDECDAWRELAEALNPMRVATCSDMLALEMAASAIATARRARFSADEFSDVVATNKAARAALADFGLTPSTRSKVSAAPEAPKKDPLAEFLS
ncbi:MAG: hypothetical protein WCS72_19405 [Deltaproteobacteria bacterium]